MRTLRLIALTCVLGLFSVTAHAEVARQDTPIPADVQTLAAGNTAFAFDLYHEIAQEQDGNLIFSPYSISMAFAMLYAGARGDTAAQMAQTLHFDLSPEQLHPAFDALNAALQPPPQPSGENSDQFMADDLTLNIANGVWGQAGFPFEQAYVDVLTANYGITPELLDFNADPDAARETMRQWIEDATNGKIIDMPPAGSISPAMQLALVNAIYFKAEWQYPFMRTSNSDFHLLDGGEVNVPMMNNGSEVIGCFRGETYKAIELSYGETGRAAMLIMLPNEGSFEVLDASLEATLFHDVVESLETTNMTTFVTPRFEFDAEVDLHQVLSAMGMTLPFSADADFSGIRTNSTLEVDYAGHKATISVDELGTEASAVTTVTVESTPPPLASECGTEVIADRPFMFIIYDRPTNAILFMGRVMNPAA